MFRVFISSTTPSIRKTLTNWFCFVWESPHFAPSPGTSDGLGLHECVTTTWSVCASIPQWPLHILLIIKFCLTYSCFFLIPQKPWSKSSGEKTKVFQVKCDLTSNQKQIKAHNEMIWFIIRTLWSCVSNVSTDDGCLTQRGRAVAAPRWWSLWCQIAKSTDRSPFTTHHCGLGILYFSKVSVKYEQIGSRMH